MLKRLAAWVAAFVLASCGGGAGDATRGATPAAAVAELRATAQALAPSSATSAAAADQLMNFGESVYGQYFPGHKATQSFPPFLYRYYPETNVYLGVVVTDGAGYPLGGVYVMGGAFGNSPLFVGPLTAFITPDPGGANNGCYDFALFGTAGTRLVVDYETSGGTPATSTVVVVVGGLVTFEGHEAREASTATTERTSEGTFTGSGRIYSQITGPAEITTYGFTSMLTGTLAASTFTVATRAVATPPSVDRTFGLAVGESITQTETQISTTTTLGVPGASEKPQVSTDRFNSTIKFLGRETITVPAGTYDTCKFEETFEGNASNTATSWVIFGKGIDVKIVNRNGGSVETEVATSVTLNGSRL